MRLIPSSALAGLLLLTLGAGAAHAEDFCVEKPRCLGTAVNAAQFQTRLSAAERNGQPDRFVLGASTFADGPYVYDSAEPIEIVGSTSGGRGTVLRAAVADRPILTLVGDGASIADVRAEIVLSTDLAVNLVSSSARRLSVTYLGTPGVGGGVLVNDGASLIDSVVDLAGIEAAAVGTTSGDSTISGSLLSTDTAGAQQLASGGHMTLARDTIRATIGAMTFGGRLTVSDTLIDGRADLTGSGVGLGAIGQNRGDVVALDADHVTIVGSDPHGRSTLGAYVVGSAGASASMNLHDTAITGVVQPLLRFAEPGGVANLTVDRTAHADPTGQNEEGAGTLTETNRLPLPTGFVDPTAGDFRLLAGSPLIDAGDPAGAALDGALDLGGAPRLTDGDGDCVARHDVGAYEYQRTGPCTPVPPTQPVVPQAPPVTPPVARVPPTQPRRDTVKPRLSALHVPARIRRSTTLPKLGANRRTPAIAFRLSERAKVTLTFARRDRRGKFRTLHTRPLRITARAGTNRLRFGGRLTRKTRLTAGRYHITLTATDAAANRSTAATAAFRIG